MGDPDSRLRKAQDFRPWSSVQSRSAQRANLHGFSGSCPGAAKVEAVRSPTPKAVQMSCVEATYSSNLCASVPEKKVPKRLPWNHSLEGTWFFSCDTWLWRASIQLLHGWHVGKLTPHPPSSSAQDCPCLLCSTQCLSSSTIQQSRTAQLPCLPRKRCLSFG